MYWMLNSMDLSAIMERDGRHYSNIYIYNCIDGQYIKHIE